MWQNLLADASFWRWLLRLDEDLARAAQVGSCPFCGASLHAAHYPRKPRGGPAGLGAAFAYRFSFCCARDGCRRRLTPFSVRFLARRVYLGAIVLLAAAAREGLSPRRAAELSALLHVPRRTLERWIAWWRSTFATSPFWQVHRAQLATPVPAHDLPGGLLDRFLGTFPEPIVACLRFLLPITSASAPGSCAM